MNITSTVRRRRLVGALAAALVGLALFLTGGATPAHGVELPTWDDVQAAKRNEATAAAKVMEIEGLLEQSLAELDAATVAEAHRLIESGAAAGKITLAGFTSLP